MKGFIDFLNVYGIPAGFAGVITDYAVISFF
jgi:hypothetical protein